MVKGCLTRVPSLFSDLKDVRHLRRRITETLVEDPEVQDGKGGYVGVRGRGPIEVVTG